MANKLVPKNREDILKTHGYFEGDGSTICGVDISTWESQEQDGTELIDCPLCLDDFYAMRFNIARRTGLI